MANRLPDRTITPHSIRAFKGISMYKSILTVPFENALDLLNVIVSGEGHLAKMRLPTDRTGAMIIGGLPVGRIDTFIDFQQGIGTRQLLCQAQQTLFYLLDPGTGGNFVPTFIESNPLNVNRYNYTESNNIAFLANGTKMLKWTGTQLWKWGIDVPPAPPQLGVRIPLLNATRTGGNTVNVTLNTTGLPKDLVNQPVDMGDTIKIDGIVTDPTMNGTYADAVGGAVQYTSIGPNGTVNAEGFITIYSNPAGLGGTSYSRLNQITTLAAGVAGIFDWFVVGDKIIVSAAVTDPTVNTTPNTAAVTGATSNSLSYAQALPDLANTVNGTIITFGNQLFGPTYWRYGWKNSVTGHEGPSSDPSPAQPGIDTMTDSRRWLVAAPAFPDDPQVDTIVWYRSYINGGDWFLHSEVPLDRNNPYTLLLRDKKSDDELDASQRANFINYPPPVGKWLVQWQDRIFIVGIVGAPSDFVWSGYEKILRGRPEESFPPDNRGRLALGADDLRGLGMLMNGVVIWDSNNRMRFFKGTAEDVVEGQPVTFSEYLEEMPWATGVSNHESIQSTPYGVVWFGSDRTFHIWNGIFYAEVTGPTDLGMNIFPLLQRISKGTEQKVSSAYFNFLERDWYVALICVDGSADPNRIVFFDLNPDPNENAGIFISDIQADFVGVREDSNNIRHLTISQQGRVKELKAVSTAVNGINHTVTSTTGTIEAYWSSGLDGNDDADVVKMYRYGRVVADQNAVRLMVTCFTDDRLIRTLPYREIPVRADGKFTVNRKGRRCGFTIMFPDQDVDMSVLELAINRIPLSNR